MFPSLTEKIFFRAPELNLAGRGLLREAVRAVVFDGSRLFMVYAASSGEYKFPGGGVKPGESRIEALRRELSEETGAELDRVVGLFGQVVEYDQALEPGYDFFCMTSRYYLCSILPEVGKQQLDAYEQALGFQALWVIPAVAIARNTELLKANPAGAPRWTSRELYVLQQVQDAASAGKII